MVAFHLHLQGQGRKGHLRSLRAVRGYEKQSFRTYSDLITGVLTSVREPRGWGKRLELPGFRNHPTWVEPQTEAQESRLLVVGVYPSDLSCTAADLLQTFPSTRREDFPRPYVCFLITLKDLSLYEDQHACLPLQTYPRSAKSKWWQQHVVKHSCQGEVCWKWVFMFSDVLK